MGSSGIAQQTMNSFRPIELIEQRIKIAKEDSDTSMFLHLMYAAEQLTKTVTVGLLACTDDDKLKHRYSQEHRLVRADGIGEWSRNILLLLIYDRHSKLFSPNAPLGK